MKSITFAVFGIISIVWLMLWSIYVFCYHKKGKNQNVPTLMMFTIGVFFSAWMILLPACFLAYDYGGEYYYISPLMLSIFYTIRVFIMDGEYDFIVQASMDLPELLRNAYTLYGSVLLVVAPILTFSNVFYFFKNFSSELKYNMCTNRPIYIMSDLNERSVTLAKSILTTKDKEGAKPQIVFADVSQQDDESNYDLILQAKEINAICLKKNVLNISIGKKKKDVEFFLISDNESENVSYACALTDEFNKLATKQDIKIFAFAQNESSFYMLDSLRYDNLLNKTLTSEKDDYSFKLRRVDSMRQLIWYEVPKMNIFKRAENNVLSILLVGIGNYGMEFFKMLVWYCQAYGYRLEINVVDKMGTMGDKSIESLISRNCPELLNYLERHEEEDMDYSIRCISGVDMDNNTFRELLEYDGADADKQELAKRLRRTSTMIVSMGDDDRNIETSVYLRTLFEKVRMIKGQMPVNPQIYTVVHDDNKFAQGASCFLMNHEGVSYDINFIGSFSTQYLYESVYDEVLEKSALKAHNKWVQVERDENGEIAKEGRTAEQIQADEEKLTKNIQKFERFEYFRLSSMASGIHKIAMEENFPEESENGDFRQRSEHMRWNAYMMVCGYEYHSVRDDRAKMHPNLKPRQALAEKERLKD